MSTPHSPRPSLAAPLSAALLLASLLSSAPLARAAVLADPPLASGAGVFNGGGGDRVITLSAPGSTPFGALEDIPGFVVVRSFAGFEPHATAAAGTPNTLDFTDPARPDLRFSFSGGPGASINASTGSEIANAQYLASRSGVRLYPGGAGGVHQTTIRFGTAAGSGFSPDRGVSAAGFVISAAAVEFNKNRIASITATFLSLAGETLSTQTIGGPLSGNHALYFGHQSGGAAIGSVEIAIEVTAQPGQAVNLALNNLGFAAPRIARDNFNSYHPGPLHGADGGRGWAAPWDAANGVSISTEPITYRHGRALLGGGNSLKVAASHGSAFSRPVLQQVDRSGHDYFVSFIFQARGGEGPLPATIASPFLGLMAQDASPDANNDTIGFLGKSGKAGARVAGTGSNGDSLVPVPLHYGATYLFVIACTGWDGATYQSAQVWLNPLPDEQPAPHATFTRTGAGQGSDGFLGLAARTVGLNASHYYLLDELRVGRTWADVVPAPDMVLLDYQELLAIRRHIRAGQHPTNPALNTSLHAPARNKLLADAAALLASAPQSVMDKPGTSLPPSGDKHDFYAIGKYAWQIPGTHQWERRDGETNPAADGDDYDMRRYRQTVDRIQTLALASFYSEGEPFSEACAAKAAGLLRAWFLDPATRMNPHFNHSAVLPGQNTGMSIGAIEGVKLIGLLDHVRLLLPSPHWTAADHAALQAWFSEYTLWLADSPFGMAEAAALDNHALWHAAQVAACALFTGDEDLVPGRLARGRELIAAQISADGSLPKELARNRSWSYSCYALRALTALARCGDLVGHDLWHYQSPGGQSLASAFAFIVPHLPVQTRWQWGDPKLPGAPKTAATNYDWAWPSKIGDHADPGSDASAIELVRWPLKTYRTPALRNAGRALYDARKTDIYGRTGTGSKPFTHAGGNRTIWLLGQNLGED